MNKITKKPLKKEQVASDIRAYINENSMPAGTRLMSEKKLASHFNVNHLTIRSALSILEAGGVLERRPGSGTYIKINATEKRVASQQNELVAMLIHSQGHLYEELKNELFVQLYQQNIIPAIFPTDADGFEKRIVNELIQLQSQGCQRLIINQTAFGADLFDRILQHPDLNFTQIVRILGNKPDPAIMFGQRITFDYEETFRVIVNYLKNLGHKRITLLVGNQDFDMFGQSNRKTTELFTQAMIQANLAETMGVCVYTYDNDSKKRLKEVLSQKNRPTALLGDIDWRGVEALKMARKAGLRVPEDISIMGLYNTPWAEHLDMTSVKYDLKQFALMVSNAISQNSYGPVQLIKPELVVRETTGMLTSK